MGNQYGIKEVMNLGFIDYSTKKPFAYADYATVTTNEVQGERLFIQGGQGNYRLMAFDHTKTSTLQVTLPLVDISLLAMLAGDSLTTGVAQAVYKREVLTVASGKVTLAETPIDNTIAVFALSGKRDHGQEYTKVASAPTGNQFSWTSGQKDVNFNTSENGKTVVVWYKYNTPTTVQKFSIAANKFPKTCTIFGEGLWKNEETEIVQAVRATYLKAMPQSNFTLTMSSDNATTLEMTFDLLAEKVGNDYIYVDYVLL